MPVLPLARHSAILVTAATLAALAPGTARADTPSAGPVKNEEKGWYLDSGSDTSDKAPASTSKYTGEPASAPGSLKWSYDAKTKLIRNESSGCYLGSGGDTSSDKAPAYTTKYTADPASAPAQLKWSYDTTTKLIKNEANGWYLGSGGGGSDGGYSSAKAPAYTTKYTESPASAPAQLKWTIPS
jgi:hypothetical protein